MEDKKDNNTTNQKNEQCEEKEKINKELNNEIKINKKDENNTDINNLGENKTNENKNPENSLEKNKEKIIPITKYSSLSQDLFSLPYISEYKCSLCGLIPSPENANELICCGVLFCEECCQKMIEEKKGCPACKSLEMKNRKIKDENKAFYKFFKNFIIKCPYKCEWKGFWIDLDTHLNECKYSFRYCKYKSVGCEYVNDNKNVIEHEQKNDQYHFELALKYIKTNNITKKILKYIIGDKIWVSCHSHEMTYTFSSDWICDGADLPNGCYSINNDFNRDVPRYRCNLCDFDLCDKCAKKYVINK